MGTWDKYKTDENDQPGFVELKNEGDEFTGVLLSVEDRVIPANTFSYQPEDLTVPSVTFRGRSGRSMKLDLTSTVLRNQFVDEAPEVGDEVTIVRGAIPKGKRYILFTVKVSRGAGSAAPKAAAPADPWAADPAPGNQGKLSDEPPF